MAAGMPAELKDALTEKLVESLTAPLAGAAPRRAYGTVALPGKVTAVIGMRRAGKTTFLHQLRREHLASDTPREHLPHVNFEDERLAGSRRANSASWSRSTAAGSPMRASGRPSFGASMRSRSSRAGSASSGGSWMGVAAR